MIALQADEAGLLAEIWPDALLSRQSRVARGHKWTRIACNLFPQCSIATSGSFPM